MLGLAVIVAKRMSTVSGTPEDWKRTGARVRDRRVELGLTMEQALERARPKVSRSVWSNLERGAQDSFQVISLAAIARALQWTPDSIERILTGEEPTVPEGDEPLMAETEVRRQLQDLRQDVAELRQLLEELVRRAEEAPGS